VAITMATGGIPGPGSSKFIGDIPLPIVNKTGMKRKKAVKVFITSYSDEFYAERELIRKEVTIIFIFCHNINILLLHTAKLF
jgi:hypothetical protein